MQLQDFGPAIEKLKNQLERDPENIQLLLQLVELYLKIEGDEYFNSVIYLDKILELDPPNFAANRIRGLIYKDVENYEEALKCFETILEHYSHAKNHPEYREIRFDYAEILEQMDKDEEALDIYRELLEGNPKDIAVLFKMAHFNTILENNDDAISNYKRILEIDPDNEAALSQLVELYDSVDKALYHKTKAELAVKEGSFNRAISEYKKLLTYMTEPEDECMVHIKIANIYTSMENFNHALDSYNLAADLVPEYPEIYKGIGRVYFETEEYEDAIEYFEKALALNENDYLTRVDLADSYIELERYPEAVRELETIKKHRPDDLDIRCGLAEGYVVLRDLYRAKEEIDFILARDKNNTRALGTLVDLNLEKEDYESALEISKKIVKIIPNSPYSSRKLAECYEALNDEFNAHYNFALSYELQSEYGMAIDEYQTALDLDPENSEIMMKIGDLYIAMGEKFIGIEFYENAAEADENNIVALKKLSEFYLDNNEIDKAADAYSALVEVDSRNSEAHYNLAILYEKQKFLEDALETYYKFLELAPNSTKSDDVKKKVRKLEKKLGRHIDDADSYNEDDEYEEYIDDRTVFQKICDLFKR